MGLRVRTLGLALAWAALATPLAAQTRWDVGAFGGFSFPTQSAFDLYDVGYTFGGTLRYWNEDWPFALQFDGQWMTYGRKTGNPTDGGQDILGATVTGILALFPEASSLVPYMAFGGGAYNVKSQKPLTSAPDSLEYGNKVTGGLVFGGGFEYRTYHGRVVPYIDARLIGLLGSDPRETAYINLVAGVKYVIGGKEPR